MHLINGTVKTYCFLKENSSFRLFAEVAFTLFYKYTLNTAVLHIPKCYLKSVCKQAAGVGSLNCLSPLKKICLNHCQNQSAPGQVDRWKLWIDGWS